MSTIAYPSARRLPTCLLVTAVVVMATLAQTSGIAGETASKQEAAEAKSTTSTFTFPRSLDEGRDPFFPNSPRVIAKIRPVDTTPVTGGPATLELKGISGTRDRPLAIINNQTLAEGEEQDVTTPQGRVKVLCLAIQVDKMAVKIRAQGQTQQLVLRKGI